MSHHQRSKSPLGEETSREEWRGEDATLSRWSWRDLLQSERRLRGGANRDLSQDKTESISVEKVRERGERVILTRLPSIKTKRQGELGCRQPGLHDGLLLGSTQAGGDL